MRVRRLTNSHDMSFGSGRGDFAVGVEAVAQMVKTRLLLVRGEWFLDTDAGMPYLTEILGKSVDLARAEATFKAAIVSVEGVLSLTSFDLTANTTTRKMTVTASVNTIYGETAITGIVL